MTSRRARTLAATLLGVVAVPIPAAHAGSPVAVVRGDAPSSVQIVDSDAPGTVLREVDMNDPVGSEDLVGIDRSPSSGVVYALGVDAAANTGTLYTVDQDTWQLAPVAANAVTYTRAGGALDLPDSFTTPYDVEVVSPTVLRFVAGAITARVELATGLPVDGDDGVAPAPAGTNPDADVNGDATALNGIAASATTLYGTDSAATATDDLVTLAQDNTGETSYLSTFDDDAGVLLPDHPGGTGNLLTAARELLSGAVQLTTIDVTAPTPSDVLSRSLPLGAGLRGFAFVRGYVRALDTSVAVDEDDGTATVRLTRDAPLDGDATVQLTTTGTATAGSDFTAVTSVAFAARETARDVVVPLKDDIAEEGAETIVLTLSSASGAELGPDRTATVTIRANDKIVIDNTPPKTTPAPPAPPAETTPAPPPVIRPPVVRRDPGPKVTVAGSARIRRGRITLRPRCSERCDVRVRLVLSMRQRQRAKLTGRTIATGAMTLRKAGRGTLTLKLEPLVRARLRRLGSRIPMELIISAVDGRGNASSASRKLVVRR